MVPDIKAITDGEMQKTAMSAKFLLERINTNWEGHMAQHDGVKWTEEQGRRTIVTLSSNALCLRYWQEK